MQVAEKGPSIGRPPLARQQNANGWTEHNTTGYGLAAADAFQPLVLENLKVGILAGTAVSSD